jgi:hypothetical protein
MNIEDIMPPDWQVFGYSLNAFDPALLAAYSAVLKQFPRAYVNVKEGRRILNWAGLRSHVWKGSLKSPHRFGKALDLHGESGEETKKIYDWLIENGIKIGVKRIEDWEATKPDAPGKTGWVHMDTAQPSEERWLDKTKPYVFKP